MIIMANITTSLGLWLALLGINVYSGLPVLLSVISACLGTLVLFFATDYLTTRDSSFEFLESIQSYIEWRKSYVKGFLAWRKMVAASGDIEALQEKELMRLLTLNSNTEYYKKWGLNQIKSREDLVRIHPLVKYNHFAEYYDRMIEAGEENVICSQSPVHYALTSGTTGKPSRVPILPFYVQLSREIRAVQAYKVGPLLPANKNLSRDIAPDPSEGKTFFWRQALSSDGPVVPYRGTIKGRQIQEQQEQVLVFQRLKFYYNVRRTSEKSANGTLLGPATTLTSVFPHGDMFTTPVSGYEIEDETSARYVHLLFGLHERDLRKIETYFAPIILFAFVELEANWKDLVQDVRHGSLNSSLTLRDDIRHDLQTRLRPNPERATELNIEFSKGFKNIAKRIWPKLEVIECGTSGSFAHYADLLKSQYTGDVLLWSNLYGSSEVFLSINLWPNRSPPSYLIWPFGTFIEFIPLENVTESAPPTLFMDQVKIGEDYEIVLTTAAGLYRYRLGDIIRVVDFFNECLVIEFLYRAGSLFSLKEEKVSEIAILDSLKEVVEEFANTVSRVVEFTCCESVTLEGLDVIGVPKKASVPYYVTFVELATGAADMRGLQEKVEKQWDATLIKNHGRYAFYRNKGAIDHMKACLLKPGAFVRLRNFIIDNSTAAPSQMKMPRMLRKPELLQFVWNERIVQS